MQHASGLQHLHGTLDALARNQTLQVSHGDIDVVRIVVDDVELIGYPRGALKVAESVQPPSERVGFVTVSLDSPTMHVVADLKRDGQKIDHWRQSAADFLPVPLVHDRLRDDDGGTRNFGRDREYELNRDSAPRRPLLKVTSRRNFLQGRSQSRAHVLGVHDHRMRKRIRALPRNRRLTGAKRAVDPYHFGIW